MHYLIGVDVGTSSCKAAVFDDELRLCALAQREYPLDAPRPCWAEFQPERLWDAVCETVRSALAQLDGSGGHEFGLCFSVFGDALIVADGAGRVRCPGILSTDTRSATIAERIARDVGCTAVFARTGRLPHNSAPALRMMWVRENLPEMTGADTHFFDVLGWLHVRLGLGAVSDYSNASGSMLFEIDAKRWCGELLSYAVWRSRRCTARCRPGPCWGVRRRKPPARSALLTRAPSRWSLVRWTRCATRRVPALSSPATWCARSVRSRR